MRRRKRRRFSFYLSVPEGLVARSGFIAMTGSLLEPGLPRLSVPSADVGPANIADKSASKFDAALDSVIVRSFSLLLSSSLFSLLLPLLLLLLSRRRCAALLHGDRADRESDSFLFFFFTEKRERERERESESERERETRGGDGWRRERTEEG